MSWRHRKESYPLVGTTGKLDGNNNFSSVSTNSNNNRQHHPASRQSEPAPHSRCHLSPNASSPVTGKGLSGNFNYRRLRNNNAFKAVDRVLWWVTKKLFHFLALFSSINKMRERDATMQLQCQGICRKQKRCRMESSQSTSRGKDDRLNNHTKGKWKKCIFPFRATKIDKFLVDRDRWKERSERSKEVNGKQWQMRLWRERDRKMNSITITIFIYIRSL